MGLLSTIATGGLSALKKAGKNVLAGKGVMGNKTSGLSKFRDWKAGRDQEKSGKLALNPAAGLASAEDFATPELDSLADMGSLKRPNPFANKLQAKSGGLF